MPHVRTAGIALLLLVVPGLYACQAMFAATSTVTGGIACSTARNNHEFPAQGSTREISVRFTLRESGMEFSDVARCEYQGSICGDGYWSDIWYASDGSETFVWELADGNKLVHRPHSMCIVLSEYSDACRSGSCDARTHFSMVVEFSEDNAIKLQDRIREVRAAKFPGATITYAPGRIVDRLALPIDDMAEFGVHFETFEISVSGSIAEQADAPNEPLERSRGAAR